MVLVICVSEEVHNVLGIGVAQSQTHSVEVLMLSGYRFSTKSVNFLNNQSAMVGKSFREINSRIFLGC